MASEIETLDVILSVLDRIKSPGFLCLTCIQLWYGYLKEFLMKIIQTVEKGRKAPHPRLCAKILKLEGMDYFLIYFTGNDLNHARKSFIAIFFLS